MVDDNSIAKGELVFTSCNICGFDKYDEICDIKISPLLVPSKLVKCKKCGFFYANPRLERKTEEDYYRKHYHEIQGKDYWYEGRIDVFRRSLREIGRFLKKGKLIDVGCGMGYFMDLARTKGWEVKGVEISDFGVGYARENLALDVSKGDLKDAGFETEYFDAATMWNVLDQVYDPKANLIELNRILKKGGYLFVRVPNLYLHLKLFKLYNYNRLKIVFRGIANVPLVFHLYPFDKNSIRNLLESTGFSNVLVKTDPMNLEIPSFFNLFGRKIERIIRKSFDLVANLIYFLTLGKIVVSPSIFVIARKTA